MEGTSELFASLTGDVPEEQWELYKEHIKFGGYIVDNDSDEDNYLSDGSISGGSEEEFFTANVELIEEEDEEEVPKDEENNAEISWGCDAADKYAQGKITFVELNSIMEDCKPKTGDRTWKKMRLEQEKSSMPASPEDKEAATTPKKKPRGRRRKKNLLPKELEGLMGAANNAYAEGNVDDAIKMCMELIRLAPTANEPFQTLGVIYDEMGESRKAFQCYLVAAFLNPSDTNQWIHLADISIEQNELQQAISCYTRVLRNEPGNVSFMWERCNLHEQLGERKRALAGYELILKHLCDPTNGEKCINMAKEIAKVHHDNTDDVNAVKVLETAFTKFPSLVTSEDVNFLLELQLSQKFYKAAVKTLVQHCGVKLQMPLGDIYSVEALNDFDDSSFKAIISCIVPEGLHIDLTVKFLICLIQLKASKALQPLFESLKKENPEEIGDLFIDVAEAFMEVSEYQDAIILLQLLLSTSAYNLPGVWMKYADCLYALNQIESAIVGYEKVIEMTPTYQDARLALSRIYWGRGQVDEALNSLQQDYESGGKVTILGTEALYERCKLLESQGRKQEFLTAGILLQYSHCFLLETPEEFKVVISSLTYKRRIEVLKEIKSQSKRPCPEFIGKTISFEEMFAIFKKVCDILMEEKRFQELQNLSLAVLSSSLFMKNPETARDLEFQALLSCFYNGNYHYTVIMIRDLVLRHLNSNKAWNLFSLIITKSQENRHNRFCLRLMMKNQDNLPLGYLNGHNAMISGTYKHALGEYMCILKDHPNDVFVVFCVGITFIHMACQKFATKRHLLTVQGFAFLMRYLKLKGKSQETLYNIGRALHQLGIKDVAVHYYKMALCEPPIIKGEEEEMFDLRREIAYNLCLIYQATGAMDLVYMYSRKYIVV